jgi:uncharacterized protein YycO
MNTMKKKIKFNLFIVFVILGIMTITNLSNNTMKASAFAGDGTNNLSYVGLVPGDIIVVGTEDTFFDYLIPGEFSHTEIFAGLVDSANSIWDRDHHQWMLVGTPYVIHSTKSSEAGNGLGYSTWATGINEHAKNAVALRVNGLTNDQRLQAFNWMKSRLSGGLDGYPIGPAYDWGWTSKQITGTNGLSGVNGYYCSELAWAAYKTLFNIDLDPDGDSWSWTTAYGVSPSDLYSDSDTSVITLGTWDPADIYYVKVNLVGIYYEDDYDPWPKGAGEEYVKWFVGDAMGGSSYIVNNFYGTRSRDGAGYVNWLVSMANVQIPKTHPLKIRVEAWEDDSWPDSDDRYGVFNWYESNMLNYVNTGWWYWNYVDLGAARYYIEFSISTNSIGLSPNGL